MYLGICEWQGTWRDRAREMTNGWKDRKEQRAEEGQGKEGETAMADKKGGVMRERDRRQDRERQEWSFEPSGPRNKAGCISDLPG